MQPTLTTGPDDLRAAREAVDAFVATLQLGIDSGDADTYNAQFADDVLWGTPSGETVVALRGRQRQRAGARSGRRARAALGARRAGPPAADRRRVLRDGALRPGAARRAVVAGSGAEHGDAAEALAVPRARSPG